MSLWTSMVYSPIHIENSSEPIYTVSKYNSSSNKTYDYFDDIQNDLLSALPIYYVCALLKQAYGIGQTNKWLDDAINTVFPSPDTLNFTLATPPIASGIT